MFLTKNFKGVEYRITNVCSSEPFWLQESYEHEEEIREAWWDIQPGDVVFDVGAAYGSYTLAALAAGASLVLAFEPSRADFFDLCTNLLVNSQFSGTSRPLPVMLGETSRLFIGFYEQTHSSRPGGGQDNKIMFSLDGLVEANSFPRLDWLKIDVEGMELDVLKGGIRTLERLRPKILVEYHPEFVTGIEESVREFLLKLDYQEEVKRGVSINDIWARWIPPC